MQSAHINPFLESATFVIEQTCMVKPSRGNLQLKNVSMENGHIWLQISMFGQMKGDVVFGFPEEVAIKIVSAMMGGYPVTELDEMSRSAISELGNMISGNASTIMSNQGIVIDISPPKMLSSQTIQETTNFSTKKAIAIPISLGTIGDFEIYVTTLD
jgi:chemotaxis protein CheX